MVDCLIWNAWQKRRMFPGVGTKAFICQCRPVKESKDTAVLNQPVGNPALFSTSASTEALVNCVDSFFDWFHKQRPKQKKSKNEFCLCIQVLCKCMPTATERW